MELVTGGNSATMKVEVHDKNDKFICKLDDGQRLLGSYPIDDGMRIHVSKSTESRRIIFLSCKNNVRVNNISGSR